MTLQAKPKVDLEASDEFNKKGCIIYTQKNGGMGLLETDDIVRFSRDSDGEIRIKTKKDQFFFNTNIALLTYVYMHLRFHGGVVDIQKASQLDRDDPLYNDYLKDAEDPKMMQALLKRVKRLTASDFTIP